ncbi:hypothetical protein [Duganella sp. HH101]|uniref:hypothetical protein n=1 Tax=Duganella sp. HH101 TaxID=1781066 RepID=UPI000892F371|nr:hypothetical protein [Duganella sp. HH101]OFA03715.1 hypothetical protein DUGA2_27530 [Duganella sp. HH101]
MKRNFTININEMLTASNYNPAKDDLNLSLQSFAKRCDYSRLHYHELQKYSSEEKLLLERSGLFLTEANDIFPQRQYYEAHTIALAQNLHAACDSIPLMITLVLGRPKLNGKEFSESKIGWNKDTLNYLKLTSPFQKKLLINFERFSANEDFLILKSLVNQSKHKFLVRILNDEGNIHFEKIRYHPQAWTGALSTRKSLVLDTSGRAAVENLNVIDFMRRCHNNLLPRLYLFVFRMHQAINNTNF